MSIVEINNKLPKLNGKFFRLSNLPPYTLRLKFKDGQTPTFRKGTGVQVSSSPNIWDLTYENSDWRALLQYNRLLLEVIDGNTLGVKNMIDMFSNCDSLTSVCMLDTSKVTDMNHMFYGCVSLTNIPLFDTSKVTNMEGMLGGCNLTTIPLFNTYNVTNMGWMFAFCGSLTTIPLFNTSKVTDMSYMFYLCPSLSAVSLFDTSNVTNMHNMFRDNKSLITVPLFDTYKVTDMGWMFNGCSSLTSIPLFNTTNATTIDNAFQDCTNVQSGALALYQQASIQPNVPTHNNTFKNCGRDTQTGAAELAQIPSSWGGTGV